MQVVRPQFEQPNWSRHPKQSISVYESRPCKEWQADGISHPVGNATDRHDRSRSLLDPARASA
jgi:hypothetical protein